MRIHVVGLPHTETTAEYVTCAYTQKIVKFGKMMTDAGHEVIIYAGERNEAVCAEHVPLVTAEQRLAWYGTHDQNGTWGNVTWDATHIPWMVMNHRAIAEISQRASKGDIVLLSTGNPQQPIRAALPKLICAEGFVGYEGIILNPATQCAFESNAWRHYLYAKWGIIDGRYYDTVIPNYFDASEFRLEAKDDPPYLLYVGRLISRKGIMVAREIATAARMRLKVAGPGAKSYRHLVLETTDGCRLPQVDYVGPVSSEGRAELMARATAVLAPTSYIEPFGGVAVEAMLSGTPVIATDWGAFTETIEEGVSGYRFHTLAEGVQAVERARGLESSPVRDYALARYSLEAVAPRFTEWLERLQGLYGIGWSDLSVPVQGSTDSAEAVRQSRDAGLASPGRIATAN